VLLKTAADPKHPMQIKAAVAIANRVGLHPVQEVKVHHSESLGTKVERLKDLAALLGIDLAAVVGPNLEPVKQIEHRADSPPVGGKIV
jgi:hypothetical protein